MQALSKSPLSRSGWPGRLASSTILCLSNNPVDSICNSVTLFAGHDQMHSASFSGFGWELPGLNRAPGHAGLFGPGRSARARGCPFRGASHRRGHTDKPPAEPVNRQLHPQHHRRRPRAGQTQQPPHPFPPEPNGYLHVGHKIICPELWPGAGQKPTPASAICALTTPTRKKARRRIHPGRRALAGL